MNFSLIHFYYYKGRVNHKLCPTFITNIYLSLGSNLLAAKGHGCESSVVKQVASQSGLLLVHVPVAIRHRKSELHNAFTAFPYTANAEGQTGHGQSQVDGH